MNQSSLIRNYLESNNIHIIDIHIGKSICIVVKHVKIDVLTNILDFLTDINVIDIIPTVMGHYHYLFIAK